MSAATLYLVSLTLGGLIFVGLFLALRRTRRSYYLLLPAAAWLLAAFDQWYIMTYLPHMNIRVDALLCLALMAITTPVGILLTIMHRRS
ncbi:hypothetical protein [Planobispora longispora]|uniref:Uncharacterized protein n=1 Tax=Planobispora longispora TaxID=28887 RepID=A0A8J3RJG1_9ACTN|nr:hypothetical protein [Planobispora longispora]BFE85024.1 hypothetical protein GCM10020093_076250 [Planobispora longispora]GIH75276.1 hypothetical protein Plo01_17050 [Planobispora longispora]